MIESFSNPALMMIAVAALQHVFRDTERYGELHLDLSGRRTRYTMEHLTECPIPNCGTAWTRATRECPRCRQPK